MNRSLVPQSPALSVFSASSNQISPKKNLMDKRQERQTNFKVFHIYFNALLK